MKNARAYSILIVDDEPELCEAVATAFEMKGHLVLKAPNGQTALEIVKQKKLDLVLSDIRMSEGDGVKLLGYIKDMNINRPLVALMTGYADVTREEMYELGAEAVFEKPFKVMELIKQLTKSLDTRGAQWSEKPNVLPVLKIKREGVRAADFKFGRGGFRIELSAEEPKNGQLVEFDVQFDGPVGDVRTLRGLGLVRWVKVAPKASCGIEILYLDESVRQKVIDMIEKEKPRTFIPKG
ncbi:MAG TPA: response regulator [Bdellovibrionales bacterium]|nr:response regulator [Bdellovibrionales bacterium]